MLECVCVWERERERERQCVYVDVSSRENGNSMLTKKGKTNASDRLDESSKKESWSKTNKNKTLQNKIRLNGGGLKKFVKTV